MTMDHDMCNIETGTSINIKRTDGEFIIPSLYSLPSESLFFRLCVGFSIPWLALTGQFNGLDISISRKSVCSIIRHSNDLISNVLLPTTRKYEHRNLPFSRAACISLFIFLANFAIAQRLSTRYPSINDPIYQSITNLSSFLKSRGTFILE